MLAGEGKGAGGVRNEFRPTEGAGQLSLGIDIGGTFTDLVALDGRSGRAFVWKEVTTPDDPARGVLAGMQHLLARSGIDPAAIGRVVHATTLVAREHQQQLPRNAELAQRPSQPVEISLGQRPHISVAEVVLERGYSRISGCHVRGE